MPCHPARARELVRRGRAVRRFSKGVFYIRLLDRMEGAVQPVAAACDPGSKREGYTVKSAAHTYLNVDADAVTHVSEAIKSRRYLRNARRCRKTPHRPRRPHRAHGGLPHSTRARWHWRLRILCWLQRLYPVSMFVVEDITGRPRRGRRRWNASFSPLTVGKQWFYAQVQQCGALVTRKGFETYALRHALGLTKTRNKMADTFWAHCVDSWVLAASAVGGTVPDNMAVLRLSPLRLHRRQLHRIHPARGSVRWLYGGTRSLGLKRGALVRCPRFGLAYVGGAYPKYSHVSLHDVATGRRVTQHADPGECVVLAWNAWRTRVIPATGSRIAATTRVAS